MKSFDLIYYDSLAGQDSEIILTVTKNSITSDLERKLILNRSSSIISDDDTSRFSGDSENVPPLELVIKTRWPKSSVTWNCEPLL